VRDARILTLHEACSVPGPPEGKPSSAPSKMTSGAHSRAPFGRVLRRYPRAVKIEMSNDSRSR
jgi:hypothetical protein